MNEKTINEQYAYIRSLLEEKRLKEALMQLESLLWQCPDWDLRNRMEQPTSICWSICARERMTLNAGMYTENLWLIHGK